MCGIVLAGGNLVSRDVDIFEKMLYCDIFRGDHSTGVYSGFKRFKEPVEIVIRKAAVPADIFLRTKSLWGEVRELKTPSTVTANTFVTTAPKFMVGHNRYATQGAVIDANAHPFQHGHITLVHNGTLDDQSLLPDHKNFPVDSENIAYSIMKLGIEETIQKLNGKFTLVWHDAKLNTLNVIRNSERPFHLVECTSGDWFGASEEDMVMWILKRKKFGPSIKRHFECEVGVQYVFDVEDGFKFKEEVKHELPTFRTTYAYTGGRGGYWYDSYDDYDYGYGNGRRSQPSNGNQSNSTSNGIGSSGVMRSATDKNRELNDMLESHGIQIRVGESIHFEAFQFDPYPKNPQRGKLTGYTGSGEYIEVQAHGFDTTKFIADEKYRGVISSCYEQNYILTIIVTNASQVIAGTTMTPSQMVERLTELNTDIPSGSLTQEELDELYPEENEEDDNDAVEITNNGEVYSKKEWESNDSLNSCANCGSPIPFDDVPDVVVDKGYAFCECCAKHYGLIKEEPVLVVEKFVCECCAEEKHVDLKSKRPGFCLPCYEHFYGNVVTTTPDNSWESNLLPEEEVIPLALPKPTEVNLNVTAIRKKLQNNMLVTVKQWALMNNCGWCSLPIQWVDAEATEFVGQRPCCPKCSRKLEMGIIPKPNAKE